MTDERDTKPQFAPPPNPSGITPGGKRSGLGARIPCTRTGCEGTDADAAAVWAFALGLAIGTHGVHWARSFDRSIVRVHVDEGTLEVFLHEPLEPIQGLLDIEEVFECFSKAWRTIAVESERTRWGNDYSITIYEWEPAFAPGDVGSWKPIREGTLSAAELVQTTRRDACEEAIGIVRKMIGNGEMDLALGNVIREIADIAAGTFAKHYVTHTNAHLPLSLGTVGAEMVAVLEQPWRNALLDTIAITQGETLTEDVMREAEALRIRETEQMLGKTLQ